MARALSIRRLAAALVLGACGGCAEPPPPSNVLVVLVDTLRADHLGCYGYPRATSPNLDRFASEGVLFEDAFAQSSWTAPSVASLFTSVYPSAHGVVRFGSKLGAGFPTLAQEMTARGRKTVAFSANIGFVRAERGFALGFDRFEMADRAAAGPADRLERILGRAPEEAGLLTDRALRFLDEAGDEPFFLYLHYFDPHSPYDAPAPFRDRFLDETARARPGTGSQLFVKGGTIVARPADRQMLTDLYDGEVAYSDAEIGRLLGGLGSRGLARRTVVVVTSDHGEELYDHGGVSHGATLYRELVRVPLLVRVPGGAAGRRVRGNVQLVDVGPSLLELLGAPDTRATDGRSFEAMLRGNTWFDWLRPGETGSGDAAVGYSELSRSQPDKGPVPRHTRSLRAGSRSLLAGDAGAREFYDFHADPGEKHDLAAAEAEAVRGLATRLDALSAASQARGPAAPGNEHLDEADQERLKALGYLQ